MILTKTLLNLLRWKTWRKKNQIPRFWFMPFVELRVFGDSIKNVKNPKKITHEKCMFIQVIFDLIVDRQYFIKFQALNIQPAAYEIAWKLIKLLVYSLRIPSGSNYGWFVLFIGTRQNFSKFDNFVYFYRYIKWLASYNIINT